jgi:hypothetical protein
VGGAWQGFFVLKDEVLWSPEDSRCPYALIFDTRTWRVITAGRRLIVDVARAVVPLWNMLFGRIRKWSLPSCWEAPRGPVKRDWVPPPAHDHLHAVLRTRLLGNLTAGSSKLWG